MSKMLKLDVKPWIVAKCYTSESLNNIAIIEYFHSKNECLEYIENHKSDGSFTYWFGYYDRGSKDEQNKVP